MHRLTTLGAIAALLTACAVPNPPGQPPMPSVSVAVSEVQQLGSKLTVTTPEPGATTSLTLTNRASGATKVFPLEASGGTVTLDAANLPGYDASASVQAFDVMASVSSSRGTSTYPGSFLLPNDPQVPLMPLLPPEYPAPVVDPEHGPALPFFTPKHWKSLDSTEGPATYVQHAIETLAIANATSTSAPATRADVAASVPSPLMSEMPASIQLVRYEIRGTFPKYLLTEGQTHDGKPAIRTPTMISVILTKTDPTDLVSQVVD